MVASQVMRLFITSRSRSSSEPGTMLLLPGIKLVKKGWSIKVNLSLSSELTAVLRREPCSGSLGRLAACQPRICGQRECVSRKVLLTGPISNLKHLFIRAHWRPYEAR